MLKIICKPLLPIVMALGLTGITTVAAQAAPLTQQSFQQVLQEERSWAGLTTRTLKVGDIEWTYSEGGDKAKPTVMLVHGLSGSRDNWNRVARYLTPYYHVIIPDLPAHGDTKVPAEFDLQIPNMVEALRRFTEAASINKNLNVAGHSLGGAVAGLYSAQYFFDVQSLLLIDSAGVFKSTQSPYLKDPTLLRDIVVTKPGDFDKLMKIAMYNPPFIPSALKQEQEKVMIAQADNTRKVIEQLIKLYGYYTPETFALAARAIEAPTLIIWGKQDKIIDVNVVPELKGLIKNAQEPVILPNVGHTPILEAEQLVIQKYLPFLQKAVATPNPFAGSAP
ncbi:alpha/beta hydrolase [Alkanindiges hydrocarboniclasticus]|uniref:Alpha/beta hydrolase n=1 Tax=Alkanindiges hydrocarboniclasticus TaxID=1907941 RepID=A0A1S8CZK3_9GAMM|nr:alpha/beta hydrolase [Alkanindiges hydrocarboniclasticus]